MSACHCTATEVCFPCRDREAHRAPEPVTAADPALLVPGSEWMDTVDGEVVRLLGVELRTEHRCEVIEGGPSGKGALVWRWIYGDRWQRVSPPPAEAPDVEPATSQVSSSREVEPATDEVIAAMEVRDAAGGPFGKWDVRALIARVRQERAGRDRAMDYADEQSAEAARLREQVEEARDLTRWLVRDFLEYSPGAETQVSVGAACSTIAEWDAEPTATEGGDDA